MKEITWKQENNENWTYPLRPHSVSYLYKRENKEKMEQWKTNEKYAEME